MSLSARDEVTHVKICGLTRAEDACLAVQLGADALGCNLYEGSSRHVTLEAAAHLLASTPDPAVWVAVLVNPEPSLVHEALRQAPFDQLQFHGEESRAFCESFGLPYIKAIRAESPEQIEQAAIEYPSATAILLDAFDGRNFGGTGKTFDWQMIPAIKQPLMLAGGLNPGNVGEAIRQAAPDAVDACSGIECAPGIKDHGKLRAFMAAVKAASSLSVPKKRASGQANV